MPINAGAVGIQPITQQRPTTSTDGVQRREDGTSAGFRPQTNVALKTAIEDLAATLGRISSQEAQGVERLPLDVRQIVSNILQQSFAMEETLGKGIGSTIESMRFSTDQLALFARMLSQIGVLAEKGFSVELPPDTKALFAALKGMLVAEGGGKSLEPVLIAKAAFDLLDSKTPEQLPPALQEFFAQEPPSTEGMRFLKQLVEFFMPRPTAGTTAQNQAAQQQAQVMQQMPRPTATQQLLNSMYRQFEDPYAKFQQQQAQTQNQPQFQQQAPQTQNQPQFQQQAPQSQNQPQFQQQASQSQNQPQFQQQASQSQNQPQFQQQAPQSQNQPQLQQVPQSQNQPQFQQAAPQSQNQPQFQPTTFENQNAQGSNSNFQAPQSPQPQQMASAQQIQQPATFENQNAQVPNSNFQAPQSPQTQQMAPNQQIQQPATFENQNAQVSNSNFQAPQSPQTQQMAPNQQIQQPATFENQNAQVPNSNFQAPQSPQTQQMAPNQQIQQPATSENQNAQVPQARQAPPPDDEFSVRLQKNPQLQLDEDFVAQQKDLQLQVDAARTFLLREPFQNSPITMDALKNLAQFFLRQPSTSPNQQPQLQHFLDNHSNIFGKDEARHLQNLLRLCQQNVPIVVQQAAARHNLPNLPRLWAFMQLCDLASVHQMSPRNFKRAARDLSDFSNVLRNSFAPDNSNSTAHRSFQFFLPLFLDATTRYPAFLNVYDQPAANNPSGAKETWLRICVLTDNIGAADLIFRLYENNHLDLRLYFSNSDSATDFKQFVPELRRAFPNFQLGEIRIGSVGEKLLPS